MNKITATLFSLTLISITSAYGAPLRLIETAPGHQSWLNSAQITELSRIQHSKGKCGGFMDVTEDPVAQPLNFGILSDFSQLNPKENTTVDKLMPELNMQNVMGMIKSLSNYHSRYYNHQDGVTSANFVADQFRKLSAGRTDIKVELVKHNFLQPSVIARIEGSGQHASEIIVIGGHQDSINHELFGQKDAAPGADDNASGTATVLEIFRVLAQSGYRPDRTIEFMAYAGEEVGLLGSQAIAKQYKNSGKLVRSAMQFDMTMYPGPNKYVQLVTDYVNPSLTEFTKKLIDTYVKVQWGEMQCGYACSDHASWNRAGYPSVFPFEAPMGDDNPSIHTSEDTINKLDSNFGLHFAKLGLAYVVELAAANF